MIPEALCTLLLALSAPAAGDVGRIELVETAPVETSLDHADLREMHAVWREMIDGARERIELAHFYASDRPGSRLEAVVLALEAAAERGVRVRFLADQKFSATYPETLERLDAREGIEVRRLDLGPHTGGVLHAKYLLVDARELLVGSANFDWRSLEHIQELGVRVEQPELARALLAVFDSDWALAAGEEAPPAALDPASFPVRAALEGGGEVRVTPLFSPLGLPPGEALWDLERLVAAIDGARERVLVQLLSYGTTDREGRYFDALENALRRAAARGVGVKLLLADWCKRRYTI
jgi:phosphatidylserine/phosphatidylglycerophosphate/cardiolipin synthase-like enzyme